MGIIHLKQTDANYPDRLRQYLGSHAPARLAVVGDANLLQLPLAALFCSVKCPGSLILKAYDLAQELREAGTPVISGFHSPVEKDALVTLLRGSQPVVIALARGLEGMRMPAEFQKPIKEGRLALVSANSATLRRATSQTAQERNRLVGALAERIIVIHAETGGRIEKACEELVGWGKTVFTLKSEHNANLVVMGARILQSGGF